MRRWNLFQFSFPIVRSVSTLPPRFVINRSSPHLQRRVRQECNQQILESDEVSHGHQMAQEHRLEISAWLLLWWSTEPCRPHRLIRNSSSFSFTSGLKIATSLMSQYSYFKVRIPLFFLCLKGHDMTAPTHLWECTRWCPVTPSPGRCPVQEKAARGPATSRPSLETGGQSRSSKCASAPTTTWARTSSWLNVTAPGKLGWE